MGVTSPLSYHDTVGRKIPSLAREPKKLWR